MRIEKLQRRFSETNIAKDEIISPTYRAKINRNTRANERIRMVDDVLTLVREEIRIKIKEEVYYFVKNYRLKELCSTCSIEEIIAVLCLYSWRSYNYKLKEEETKLWKTYNLSWKLYSRVISNLLRKTRENIPL